LRAGFISFFITHYFLVIYVNILSKKHIAPVEFEELLINFMRKILFLLFIILVTNNVVAIEPVPTESILFKIGRSKDANEIFYSLNVDKNGKLDKEHPINIYWIKRTGTEKKEPLTWIQNTYAYGVEFIFKDAENAAFHFVSYKQKTFYLKRNSSGEFSIFTFAQNREIELDRIFIQIDGGSFWFPTISRVELHARSSNAQSHIAEVIHP
jgi:hypothetical protein